MFRNSVPRGVGRGRRAGGSETGRASGDQHQSGGKNVRENILETPDEMYKGARAARQKGIPNGIGAKIMRIASVVMYLRRSRPPASGAVSYTPTVSSANDERRAEKVAEVAPFKKKRVYTRARRSTVCLCFLMTICF
ncbi:hypothetical protein EVAR_61335_1 [Eumeta japonica]|uniref:Uncharacterized protein n=1 Tax=Eumeta variegata TaxID=151549 RepID=A0A4C1Y214_EUMVA|nr:hypothetical protein EVAR_61335_1 [Eumeta japonica]